MGGAGHPAAPDPAPRRMRSDPRDRRHPTVYSRPKMVSLHRSSAAAAVTLGSLGLLLAPASRAQEGPSPFRGVVVPGGALAGDADATALELNPGQLGLLDSAGAALVGAGWGRDLQRDGRGLGFTTAAPLIVPRLVAAGGLQGLWSSVPGEPELTGKLALGLGYRAGKGLGFGLGWERLLGGRYGGHSSWTAGLGARPAAWLAFGLAVRDLNQPRLAMFAPELDREWDSELALRPLGTDRLELGLGARHVEGGVLRDLQPHARLAFTLRPGLGLFAELETERRRAFVVDARGDMHRPATYRASVGVVTSLERLSLAVAGITGIAGRRVDDDAGPFGPGGALVLRSSFTRRPALVAAHNVARLKLADLGGERAFLDAVLRLRRLADDPAAGAVLLTIDELGLGLGRVEELRALVTGLRQRKPVLAYLTQPTTRDLYLASACDHVVVHPAGNVTLAGLQHVTTFYKGLLDRVGARVDLVRIAEYKGAMEPFVQDGPSPPVSENRDAILDDDWARLRGGFVASRRDRGLDEAGFDRVVTAALFSPEEARAAGLIDAVADERELEQVVRQRLGKSWPIRDADLTRRETGRWRTPRVAVILIEGAIVDGAGGGFLPSSEPLAWSERVIAALTEARSDRSIRAVVLRVNSPGGDAFASDRIAREVARLRQSGKPVIVSMGDVAASGGYYVAAPGDTILADPSTLTGSIGIFGYKVDVAGLLDQLGVTASTAKRGERADLYSPLRPWTDEERAALLARLRHFYDLFLDTVAAGRKGAGVDRVRADELGRGRVWTGSQAQSRGLVDRLGGLPVAIDEAATRAGVPVGPGGLPDLVVLPAPELDPFQALMALGRFVSVDAEESSDVSSDVPPAQVAAASRSNDAGALGALAAGLVRLGAPAWRLLQPLLLSSHGVQARLPYDLEIR